MTSLTSPLLLLKRKYAWRAGERFFIKCIEDDEKYQARLWCSIYLFSDLEKYAESLKPYYKSSVVFIIPITSFISHLRTFMKRLDTPCHQRDKKNHVYKWHLYFSIRELHIDKILRTSSIMNECYCHSILFSSISNVNNRIFCMCEWRWILFVKVNYST